MPAFELAPRLNEIVRIAEEVTGVSIDGMGHERPFLEQVQFMPRQFLQEGELPFANAPGSRLDSAKSSGVARFCPIAE
jgi:hypothetical protein